MKSLVQNGPKTMFFKDYSLLVVFDAYLRSKCTNQDIYTCDGARFGSGSFTQDSAMLVKEEEEEEERR